MVVTDLHSKNGTLVTAPERSRSNCARENPPRFFFRVPPSILAIPRSSRLGRNRPSGSARHATNRYPGVHLSQVPGRRRILRRLPLRPGAPPAQGRRQGPARGRTDFGEPERLRRRGESDGVAFRSPLHRLDLSRRRRRRRSALLHHGVLLRPQPGGPLQAEPVYGPRGDSHGHSDRGRRRNRASGRGLSPGHQASEHPHQRFRVASPHGLRHLDAILDEVPRQPHARASGDTGGRAGGVPFGRPLGAVVAARDVRGRAAPDVRSDVYRSRPPSTRSSPGTRRSRFPGAATSRST